ncbi:NAD-dependent epimerase/dehydratase family protein [Sphingomonas sp. GCM10030256]|uniref:NAD-dependent epimerase/dehydratase family protein n=1 Tax=Sphingomonas sp. GCM10030256 TaxID=3273427 RepID=UPI00360C1B2F
MKLAITGGTGFVGTRLLRLAVEAGHQVKALTRRPQPPHGVQWIAGDLSDRDALRELVSDADAAIHVAGVINAPDRRAFDEGNVGGTLALLAAITASGARRFVHVSTLAAREPDLSLYGASKARAERLIADSGLDWAIVRPPAVYGPGDRETLELFKAACVGIMPLPPAGRLSAIHVDDLGRLLLALAEPGAPSRVIYEPDDGHEGGYSHQEFARMIGEAVDRRPFIVPLPAVLLLAGARIDQLVRRDKAKLTADRAAYFCHPDWVADPTRKPPAELWQPDVPTPRGLAETADWYCKEGWL